MRKKIDERITKLERAVWVINNPPRFKRGDKVFYNRKDMRGEGANVYKVINGKVIRDEIWFCPKHWNADLEYRREYRVSESKNIWELVEESLLFKRR